MSIAPYVGLALGLVAGGVGIGAVALGASPLVAGVLTVAATAGLTRGLHLDGLADTADGLGSYRDRSGALEIMRKPDVGPFGVVVLVLVVLAQAGAAAALLTRPWLSALASIAVATAAGRLAIAAACWRRVPAARPDGLGATVAGTVGIPTLLVAAVVLGAVSLLATPAWLGPVALVVGLGAGAGLLAHAVRRLGGITGDVLGAVCEVTATLTYVVVSL
jgi:adenosylcobinamide-GDP ribazoletransferase